LYLMNDSHLMKFHYVCKFHCAFFKKWNTLFVSIDFCGFPKYLYLSLPLDCTLLEKNYIFFTSIFPTNTSFLGTYKTFKVIWRGSEYLLTK
jgi:hypothetical protein